MGLPSYPKIFNLGHAALQDLLKDDIIIEEKIDGSQFSFGIIDDELICKSHHKELVLDNAEMFQPAVDAVLKVGDKLQPNLIHRGEFLAKPKHNTLCYDRIPNNHIIIFDVDDGNQNYFLPEKKREYAETLGFECVPLLDTSPNQFTQEVFEHLESETVA